MTGEGGGVEGFPVGPAEEPGFSLEEGDGVAESLRALGLRAGGLRL